MILINCVLKYLIVFVWLINGFFCKVLNFVPRHQEIVGRILSEEYSREITFAIGVFEIIMTIWILSEFKSKLNSLFQIGVILLMNIIEFIFAKDLLLFGSLNSVFAFLFMLLIYYREFTLKEKKYV